jgi:nuclear GTP-binding protein
MQTLMACFGLEINITCIRLTMLVLFVILSCTHQDGKEPSEPVEESHEELMSDVNESKVISAITQNDKLYAAEGILDPRKRKAEKKRRKANKFSVLNKMDEDYDFKVDYQMKDAPADDEDESNDLPVDDKDGTRAGDTPEDNDLMTGVNDA